MYDFDACLVYHSDAKAIVDHLIGYLTNHAQLRIDLFPWDQEVPDLAVSLRAHLMYCATCVLVLDGNSVPPEILSEIRLRATSHLIRLVVLLMPQSENIPNLPIQTIVEYRGSAPDVDEDLEAAIVGRTPSTVIYPPKSDLPENIQATAAISGAFVPTPNFAFRPELEPLHAFWQGGSRGGVLALIGMGGSGKTTLLTRFLQELPGNVLTDSSLAQENTRAPQKLFLWSFYDNPNIEYFIRGLYTYLSGEPTTDPARDIVYRLIRYIEQNPPIGLLIAADGLEVVQENPESPGGFGLLRDSSLRHFLRRIVQGDLPIKM